MPKRVDVMNMIFFIHKQTVPSNNIKDVTDGKIVCDYKENREDPKRTWLEVGDNMINYSGEYGTPTAKLLIVKILFGSSLLTMNSRFMTVDIKNIYLNTPLEIYECIRLKMAYLSEGVIEIYKLWKIFTKIICGCGGVESNVYFASFRSHHTAYFLRTVAQSWLLTKQIHFRILDACLLPKTN